MASGGPDDVPAVAGRADLDGDGVRPAFGTFAEEQPVTLARVKTIVPATVIASAVVARRAITMTRIMHGKSSWLYKSKHPVTV